MVVAFLQTTNERSFMNLGGIIGRFETSNRTTSICDQFPKKPMSMFDLDIHESYLTANVIVGNLGGYKKSVAIGILVFVGNRIAQLSPGNPSMFSNQNKSTQEL